MPLLSNEKYTVYHPIPLPIPNLDRTIVLIATEVEYLALSDNEKFFTLSIEQWEKMQKFWSRHTLSTRLTNSSPFRI